MIEERFPGSPCRKSMRRRIPIDVRETLGLLLAGKCEIFLVPRNQEILALVAPSVAGRSPITHGPDSAQGYSPERNMDFPKGKNTKSKCAPAGLGMYWGKLFMLNSDEIAVALLRIIGKHLTINRIT